VEAKEGAWTEERRRSVIGGQGAIKGGAGNREDKHSLCSFIHSILQTIQPELPRGSIFFSQQLLN